MMLGGLCVTMAGLMWMPVLCVDNWATPDLVRSYLLNSFTFHVILGVQHLFLS